MHKSANGSPPASKKRPRRAAAVLWPLRVSVRGEATLTGKVSPRVDQCADVVQGEGIGVGPKNAGVGGAKTSPKSSGSSGQNIGGGFDWSPSTKEMKLEPLRVEPLLNP